LDPASIEMRMQCGDAFAGAVGAGATAEQAHEASIRVHTDPTYRRHIAGSGLAALGAHAIFARTAHG
jgi:hypothetical protein